MTGADAGDLPGRRVSLALLTGAPPPPADRSLLEAVVARVAASFDDLDRSYRQEWRPAHVRAHPGLPATLTRHSHTRSFAHQAAIVRAQLQSLGPASTEAEVRGAVERVLETRSMPGFSRHHWGTDVDVVSAERSLWRAGGPLAPLAAFLALEGPRFGFFRPYVSATAPATGGPARGGFPHPGRPHYQDEPWHLSYWPVADALQEQWVGRVRGRVLSHVLVRVAATVRGGVPQPTMERVLGAMSLPSYHTNVAAAP